ncbi:tetratricopeptide repeat protein [Actinoplanes oblitus]|uniref:Tetratricopeptide repeat protein n=1 Tax=Actinoplanes oblitus TaxID=3040509 RepID=A0ABY8WSC4_9ACTN|nr:tetratricopeptide repeat protein [Actinoplanes oblitus]WIM99702.1 tetratricopeptide repeat protein [Actinoplanes oblitus]
MDSRIERSRLLYERIAFDGDSSGLQIAERELDGVEADLALARGRLAHGRFLRDGQEDPQELALFDRAAELYEALDDSRGAAEALLWIGIFHQLVRHDDDAAMPALHQSRELAERAGDQLTLSYALRHLGIAEHRAGRLDTAREHLEESTRLRREVEFLPGVAANLVGLSYIAAAQGRRDDAMTAAAEASRIAESTGALAIARQAEEAQTCI